MIQFFRRKPKTNVCPKGNSGICWNCPHLRPHSNKVCKAKDIIRPYCFTSSYSCVSIEDTQVLKVIQ